ncbi:hypothetical protein FM076_25655 [Streptomyces albus subsp. chlorinus]|uniref:hypothetical protein n=1 Tax=Streptomyces albus TaxID=1888 RepID=UPI00156F4AD9|nr:hypothetical protein [Streptomyces albus]NSC24352.1 hypothetical protein [Streptomyces albus subsp. chlorinus]
MSGYHNTYEADPVGLRKTLQQLEGLAGAPKQMRVKFERTVQATSNWNGTDDDFYKQTEDQDKQQIESCRAVVDSLSEFLTGLQSAVRQSLGSIEGVHQDVQEKIHDAQSNAGDYTSGDHGKR